MKKPTPATLTLEEWPIEKLFPDPENARKHSAVNLKAIVKSLQQFGQQKNVVAFPDGRIIAGNGTWKAAKTIGLKTLSVGIFSGTAEQAKAFAIADNRTAELGEWDVEVLAKSLSALTGYDMGFSDDETKAMIESINFKPGSQSDQGRLDKKNFVHCPKCGYQF